MKHHGMTISKFRKRVGRGLWPSRNARLNFYLIIIGLVIMPVVSQADRNEIVSRILLKNQNGAIEVLLTGRRGDTLYARMGESSSGSITYDVADVQKILISLPVDEIRQAEALAAAGNVGDAVKRLRAVVQPVVPYLDLPVEGALAPALRYAEFLRREKSWAAAISVYRTLFNNPDPEIHQQAAGWLAYCHIRNQQKTEAQEYLADFNVEDPMHPGFIPGTLAGSLLKSTEGDIEGALDLAARAAALSRIDHELYPEAVFLAADAYYRMSAKVAEIPERKEVVLKKAGEVDVLPPAMTAGEFLNVASNLYARVIQYFPATTYSTEAAAQLEIIRSNAEKTQTNAPPASGVTP